MGLYTVNAFDHLVPEHQIKDSFSWIEVTNEREKEFLATLNIGPYLF
jgi:hypothetical protein